MNNFYAIALMIVGGALIAIGLPMLFLGFIMYEESNLYLGSFNLVTGLIFFKLGDNWLWREKPYGMY